MKGKIDTNRIIIKNSSHPISEMLEDDGLQHAYFEQIRNSKRRKIEFRLSWEEWILVWLSSGKLLQRGKKSGEYCMARFNDEGAYEIGNVQIILTTKNTSEGNLGKPKAPNHRMKLAKHLDTVRVHKPVIANGVYYTSCAEAGRAHGISYQAAHRRCRSNSEQFKMWMAKP